MQFQNRIKTYKEFYQFYLTKHIKPLTKAFHFLGILLVFAVIFYVIQSGEERFLWYCPIFGFGFAWFSQTIFEKNLPSIIKYLIWSLASNFSLFFETLTGKQIFKN